MYLFLILWHSNKLKWVSYGLNTIYTQYSFLVKYNYFGVVKNSKQCEEDCVSQFVVCGTVYFFDIGLNTLP